MAAIEPETRVCDCGRTHTADIVLEIGVNAIRRLSAFVRDKGYRHVFLAADTNTYALAGAKVKALLGAQFLSAYVFAEEALSADEAAVGRLLTAVPANADCIVALGSGTLNDLARYVSYRIGLPYIIVATAPSMDGYASNVSPLIVNGLKTTYEAQTPALVIGDTALLQTAPLPMLSAGLSDVFGKFTCLGDWRLSHLLTGEYYCGYVAGLTRTSVEKCLAALDELDNGQEAAVSGIAVNSVMQGLCTSGVAMSYAGNSRPASGAEHHLAHFWEMSFLFQGKKPILHGTKVGVATLAVAKLYELLAEMETVDWEAAEARAETYDFAAYADRMKAVYRHAAAEIIAEERRSGRNNTENTKARIQMYRAHWDEARQIMRTVPTYSQMKDIITRAKNPVTADEIGIDYQTVLDSLYYAKELRQRFTILQMIADLGLSDGLLPAAAAAVTGKGSDCP